MSRPLATLLLSFVVFLGVLTIIVIVRNGPDFLTILSLLFVGFLTVGLVGAMRSYDR
jgi:hypothetical protein